MHNEINLLKNNDNRMEPDLERIEKLYEFLKGTNKSTYLRGHSPKMSAKKAFAIIYYLQEHLPVFPDHIEQCWNCEGIFDTGSEGLYWESKGRHYCGGCSNVVPDNYDNNQRG